MRMVAVLMVLAGCSVPAGPCHETECIAGDGGTFFAVYEVNEDGVCKRGLDLCPAACDPDRGCE